MFGCRALWVTNVAAPYRLPVWAALADEFQLTVALLEHGSRLAKDTGQNRGADWGELGGDLPFQFIEFGTAVVRRGEARHYALYDPRVLSTLAASDVVLLGGWDSPAYLQILALAKLLRRPTVAFYESTLASQDRKLGFVATLRARYFHMVDRVVVPGAAARDAVLAMGVPDDRVHLGFNAVDVDAFAAHPFRPGEDGGHRFLYVGQLIERKDVAGLIKAFASVARSADTLTIIGRGEQRPALVALGRELSVYDRISMIDFIPNRDMPAVMARHDTLVLPSHREVWGLVINEGLAAGMSVVVASSCGVVASVREMPGVFVSKPDGSDLAEALREARDICRTRIDDPPILRHTPQEFGAVFGAALNEAIKGRRERVRSQSRA